jgi:hypothetical protein
MRNYFLSDEQYEVFQRQVYGTDGPKKGNTTLVRQNDTTSSLSDVVFAKLNSYQAHLGGFELKQEIIRIAFQEGQNSRICCEEVAAALQSAPVHWNIVTCRSSRKPENDCPAILRNRSVGTLLKTVRKCGLLKTNGFPGWTGIIVSAVALGSITACMILQGFHWKTCAADWHAVTNTICTMVVFASVAAAVFGGLIFKSMYSMIEARNPGLKRRLFGILNGMPTEKPDADNIIRLIDLVLQNEMPMAVICDDFSRVDRPSKAIIERIVSEVSNVQGRILWIIFTEAQSLKEQGGVTGIHESGNKQCYSIVSIPKLT